jgi:hypothetical protein
MIYNGNSGIQIMTYDSTSGIHNEHFSGFKHHNNSLKYILVCLVSCSIPFNK